jgi:hypothetical protein
MKGILPPETIRYVCDTPQYLMLVLKNGSVCHGWNMSQWEKYSGLNLDGFGIDELTEQKEEDSWKQACARLRGQRGPRKGLGAGTPSGRDWVWRRFEREPGDNHRLVRVRTQDNPSLPIDYEQSQRETYTAEEAARFLDAEFTERTGNVLWSWEPESSWIEPFKIPHHWPRYRALDPGYADDPAACLWGAMDERGNLFLYDEYYERGKVAREQAADILAKSYDSPPPVWTAVDPSATRKNDQTGRSLVEEYQDNGLMCVPSDGRREPYIKEILSWLKPDPERVHPITGETRAPRIYVFSHLKYFRLEVESWIRDHRGKPQEKHDHLMAALGFLLMRRPEAADRPFEQEPSTIWQAFYEDLETAHSRTMPAIGV